jgi:hypothetical protein
VPSELQGAAGFFFIQRGLPSRPFRMSIFLRTSDRVAG